MKPKNNSSLLEPQLPVYLQLPAGINNPLTKAVTHTYCHPRGTHQRA